MILYVRKRVKYGEIKGNKKLEKSNFSCQKVAVLDNFQSVIEYIKNYCKTKDFTIHYIRAWTKDDRTYIDYGNHDELFFVNELAVMDAT